MAFEQWIQNPWTQFGAALAAGFDPNRQGLGGLGQAILGTGQQMRQQSLLEQEQARQQQMADLQTRMLTARLAEQERQQGIRDRATAWAQGQDEEAQVDPVSAWQMSQEARYRKPSDFTTKLAMVGGDLDRYRQVFGSAPNINLFPSAPTGHRYKTDETGAVTGIEKIPGYISQGDQEILDAYDSANRAIDRVEMHLGTYGTEPLPTGGRGQMSAAVSALMLTTKELARLGVLSGPDVDIVMDIIGDPTELTAGIKGEDFYRGKLSEAREFIKSKVPSRLMNINQGSTQGGSAQQQTTDIDALVNKYTE